MGCKQSKPSLNQLRSESIRRTIDEGLKNDNSASCRMVGQHIPIPSLVQTISVGTASTDATDASFCWICHDEGLDENGQPLINGYCSCRGSSGHCHLSCVVKHAESRTRAAVERGVVAVNLHEKWLKCSNCEQQWTGRQLAIMGGKCSNFIVQTYPANEELKIRALGIRRQATVFSEKCTADEQESAAIDVVSSIEKLPHKFSTSSKSIMLEKHDAYYTLGRIAARRKEPAIAMRYFRDCKNLLCASGHRKDDVDMIKLEMQIVEASGLLPNADRETCNQTILKLQRVIYDERKKSFGEASQHTMAEGWNLAVTLFDLNRTAEAKALLLDLGNVARKVNGPTHPRTRAIEKFIEKVHKNEETASDIGALQ